jgi:lipoprotein signal peptidase
VLTIQNKLNCYYPLDPVLYILIMIILTTAFIVLFKKEILNDKLFALSSALIVSGGVYHIIERILNRCVLDYFKIGPLFFNLVDVVVVVNVLFLLLYTYGRKTNGSDN